ncbi:carbohydrate ABC transporter permease [Kribbella sp. GL6]|uniref:carbohydrate ABC transporter permease n=1 Tax=Kribbella sp. GL6 TaxID=3419765 RepID=UPI003CFDFEF5
MNVTSVTPARGRVARWRANGAVTGWLMFLPTTIPLLAFTIYPMVNAGWLSFTDSNGVVGKFVGLANYSSVLSDGMFWTAMWNTVYMGVGSLVLSIPLSLLAATMINSLPRCQSLFKSIFFAPNVTSAISVSIAFLYVFYPTDGGWVNSLLGLFGVEPLKFFADPALARLGVVVMSTWHGIGFLILIWIAGLQNVSPELHEAAACDGAGTVRRWWHVTVPGLRPVIFFVVVTQCIGSFKRFADVYQIGGSDGQPGGVLTTLMVYIYRTGFNTFEFGKASAASFIVFVAMVIVTAVNFRIFREKA